jgi:hypothetical protein
VSVSAPVPQLSTLPRRVSIPFTMAKKLGIQLFLITTVLTAALVTLGAASQPSVTIEKPRPVTVTGGFCRILSDGATLSGNWGPSSLPTLAFTIGPGSTMADMMHANKAKFTGPGTYKNEIVAVYLGKTALKDSYMGLGTVTMNADKHTGKFVLNDGSAAGRFDCGEPPTR